MIWYQDFSNQIQNEYPKYYNILNEGIKIDKEKLPKLKFEKIHSTKYKVYFMDIDNSDQVKESSIEYNINIKEDIESNIVKETEKEQVIKIRIGQSEFRNKLIKKDCRCKICGLQDGRFLIASHIKQWIESSNKERLDVYNGFLLCPQHDALFDKGYITFDEVGKIIISNVLDRKTRKILNVHENIRIDIAENHKKYIQWHRENRFEK
ncbi:MAG: HNH endonuclease [Tepidibacter sp.]|jgi:predicted restriction endonuclease|uniref:HNH endonuclease n=1 Tax=Tepidibacter sp. TaxID=2529387 RepID=UPI0025CBB2BA|nr:HNH endonuclease [Tepidibacter sp.]MCT4509772.1 HNH endonuclease [Tepidibacter sp.]